MLQNYEQPGHGFYWIVGSYDAINGQAPRVLATADPKLAIYQADYDGGYAEGVWNQMFLSMETM